MNLVIWRCCFAEGRLRNVPVETHQKLRVHTIVFVAFFPSTLKRSKTIENATRVLWTCERRCEWRQRFQKPPFSPFTLIRLGSVFKYLHSGQRFQMYAFSCGHCGVDDRRKRIEKYEKVCISVDGAWELNLMYSNTVCLRLLFRLRKIWNYSWRTPINYKRPPSGKWQVAA